MKFSLECSWADMHKTDINDVLVCKFEEEDNVSLPDKSMVLTPVTKGVNDQIDACRLNITRMFGCTYAIAAIDILCNARLMEVFSEKGEYISTEEGILVEVLEENIKLYLLQKTIDPPQNETSVKLVSLQNKTELFLHSIHVTMVETSMSPLSQVMMGPSIDLDKVKSMIPDTGQQLSDGAQGLLNVMESFQKNKSGASQQMGAMGMMMSMFSNMAMSKATTPNIPSGLTKQNDKDINTADSTIAIKNENSASVISVDGVENGSLFMENKNSGGKNNSEQTSTCESFTSSQLKNCVKNLGPLENIAACDTSEQSLQRNTTERTNSERTNLNTSNCGNVDVSDDLNLLEARIKQSVSEAEKRVMVKVDQKFEQLERLMNEKFDSLFKVLQNDEKLSTKLPRVNDESSKQSECNLDLD